MSLEISRLGQTYSESAWCRNPSIDAPTLPLLPALGRVVGPNGKEDIGACEVINGRGYRGAMHRLDGRRLRRPEENSGDANYRTSVQIAPL